MKKIQALCFISALSFAFSAQAFVQIRCENKSDRIHLDLQKDNSSFMLYTNDRQVLLKFDPASNLNKSVLYSSSSITDTQKHHNSVVVFVYPQDPSAPAELQWRDYDDDYSPKEYKFEDKGPLANGYVLQEGSLSGLDCSIIGD